MSVPRRHRRSPAALAALGLAVLVATAVPPLAASGAPATRPSAATAIPSGNFGHWKLAYADDFTRPLDTVKAWAVYTKPGGSNPTTAWYARNHVRVSHGQLNIRGYVDKSAKSDGRVVTGGLGLWHLPQKYGKYELLVRVDKCRDVKYAWMLWPFNDKWPSGGEVDFAEDEGGSRAVTTATTIYAGPKGQAKRLPQDYSRPVGGLSSWHVLGVVWTPKSIRYTIDGHYWGKPKTTHLPKGRMVLVLQTEGKVRPNKVDLNGGSCNAHVGWVVQYSYR